MEVNQYKNGSKFKARCIFLIGDAENPVTVDNNDIWILNNDKIYMIGKTIHLDNCKNNTYLEMKANDLKEYFVCLDDYPAECLAVSYNCWKCQKALDNCKFRAPLIDDHELDTIRHSYCISCKKLGYSCNGKLKYCEECMEYDGY